MILLHKFKPTLFCYLSYADRLFRMFYLQCIMYYDESYYHNYFYAELLFEHVEPIKAYI